MSEEQELLAWARGRREGSVVGPLWRRLCRLLGQAEDAAPDVLLERIGRYGGNSLANVVRGAGVAYAEVAHDVACELKGLFQRTRGRFARGDVASCEAFVLERMQIEAADLEALCRAARQGAEGKAVVACARAAVGDLITDRLIVGAVRAATESKAAVASQVSQQTGRRAAAAAAKAATRKSTERAAELAAKHALRQTLARVLVPLNVVWAAWAVVDIAGPALRKTIPAVTYLALLRRIRAAVELQ